MLRTFGSFSSTAAITKSNTNFQTLIKIYNVITVAQKKEWGNKIKITKSTRKTNLGLMSNRSSFHVSRIHI